MSAKPDETGREPRREIRGQPKAGDECSAVKPELSTRKLARYREIAAVLPRNGLGPLLADSWQQSLPLSPRLGLQKKDAPLALAADLRAAFEELGPTFIGFGQFLSTRPDLLPFNYIAELSKLKDSTAPVPYALLVAVIESEIGTRLEKMFATFDKEPLATASIGQVHAAQLKSGEEVVVKVQRPLIAAEIEYDLAVLVELARDAEDHIPLGSDHDLKDLLAEFAFSLRCELDYVREGQKLASLGADLEYEPGIRLPRVHLNYTTRRVIVLEQPRDSEVPPWLPPWLPPWPRWLRTTALGQVWRGRLREASSRPMRPPFGLLRSGHLSGHL
jgi:ubiquinone biosynthesis protein